MTSNFQRFDGDELQPIVNDQRQTLTRRSTDNNLDIIAHKTSRIAGELSEFKTEMRDAIKRIEAAISYNHAMSTEATERANRTAEEAVESVKKAVHDAMHEAFPEGDGAGHKAAHLVYIQEAKERAEFFSKMKLELAKWGLFSLLGFLAVSAWNSFLQGPHK